MVLIHIVPYKEIDYDDDSSDDEQEDDIINVQTFMFSSSSQHLKTSLKNHLQSKSA